jgi:DnaA family protein
MHTQLPLNVRLRDGSSFDNYYAPANEEIAVRLRTLVRSGGGAVYLWGEAGSGKTHLLEAACRLAGEIGRSSAYVPLGEAAMLAPSLFEDLDRAAVVCVDDLQAIAGRRDWETAIFVLSDRLRESEGALICAGSAAPAALGLAMPELVSRLSRDLVYALQPLSDDEKLTAMRRRAQNRGMQLADDVARYILSRYPRDAKALFALLDRIDEASLTRQRRITIPFLREIEAGAPRTPPSAGDGRARSRRQE